MSDFGNPGTASRRILHAAATVGIFTAGVKVMAMFKEVVVADSFGRSDALDAFLAAYLVPGFVIVLAAGSLNAALVPTFIQVRQVQGEGPAQNLFSSCMVWSQGLLVGLSVVLAGIGPFLIRAIGSGFSAAKLQLCTRLFYAMLPLILLGGVATNFSAILNAGKCFWFPALVPVTTPFLTLALLLTRARGWGVWSLVGGVLIGGCLECVLLGTALSYKGVHLVPRWHGYSPEVRQVGRQYIPLLVGSLLVTGVTVVDQSMAARLGTGSVAALVYGNRVISVILGLTGLSLSAAVIPYFSELVALNNWKECRHTLEFFARALLLGMTPVCILLVAFSPAIVRLLFQRGAFTSQDTVVVSHVQAMYALQIPFYAAGLLYVRMLTALKRNDLVMISAGISLALDIVLNLICMRFFGVAGIALATSLFYAVSLLFAVFMARHLLSDRISSQIAHTVSQRRSPPVLPSLSNEAE